MLVSFPRDKDVVLSTKKGQQLAFSESQQQLVNSGNNIFFPSLKVQLAYPNSFILVTV